MSNNETKELFELMDRVPNARRVALEYQRLMRKGKIDPGKDLTDAGAGWLMVEDDLLREDSAKSCNYWLVGVCVTLLMTGLCISGFLQKDQESGTRQQLALQETASGAAITGMTDALPVAGMKKKNGRYTFHDASLRDIGKMIDRRFAVHVVFDDPAMNRELFTGSMDPCQPLDAFMNVVRYSTPVDYYFKGSTLHIRASGR